MQLYFLLPYHFYYGYIIFHASLCCLIKIIIISVYEVTNVINSYVFSLPLCLTGECTIIKNWLLTPACLLLYVSGTWKLTPRLEGMQDCEAQKMKRRELWRMFTDVSYMPYICIFHHNYTIIISNRHISHFHLIFWASRKSLWHQMVMYIVYFRYFSLFILFYFVCFIEVNT